MTDGSMRPNDRFLCFTLGEEEFAIPLLSVREVIAMPDVTPVPQTPPHFLGIMNLRGQVISVMDLRTKLQIKSKVANEVAVIICDLHPNPVGVVVDSINSVISPGADQLSERPEIQSQKNTEYILGVYRDKERLVLLLDISKSLSLVELKAIAGAAAPSIAARKAA
jgi:purine-binding chemotaxis protein CheW